MNCLSCSQISGSQEISWGARSSKACRICRLGPALLTLTACITGIAVALLQKKAPLTAPFAAGGSASLYLLKMSWEHGNLKSLEESIDGLNKENHSFRENNEILRQENKSLQQSNLQLQEQLDVLNQRLQDLQRELQKIKEENADYQKHNEKHKEEIEHLKEIVAQLETLGCTFQELLQKQTVLEEAKRGELGTIQETIKSLSMTCKESKKILETLLQLLGYFDKETISNLRLEVARLEGIRDTLQSEVKRLESATDRLETQVDRLVDGYGKRQD